MICYECGGEMVESHEPIQEKYHGVELTVCGIRHYRCVSCGEIEFDAEDGGKYDKAVIDEYSKLMGILSPKEIKAIRKRHGLSQKEFEKVLGVASPTVSRWETGKVCQSKVADNLMRILGDNDLEMDRAMARAEVTKTP